MLIPVAPPAGQCGHSAVVSPEVTRADQLWRPELPIVIYPTWQSMNGVVHIYFYIIYIYIYCICFLCIYLYVLFFGEGTRRVFFGFVSAWFAFWFRRFPGLPMGMEGPALKDQLLKIFPSFQGPPWLEAMLDMECLWPCG